MLIPKLRAKIGLFLVAESVDVWFDEWDIGLGDSIPEKIEEGISKGLARRGGLVLPRGEF